jgi:hypothetical protein
MKKILTGVLAILMAGILPMNQLHASEVTLESAIQNLQYRMTVEWDQKDLKKQKEIMGEFVAQVESLKKQGVTDEQIFKSLSASAFDAQTAKEIEHLAKYAKAKKLDAKETRKLIVDYANKSQKMGANWSSEATVALIIGLVLAIVLVAALSGNLTVVAYDDPYYYDCYDDCWYDDWGYYYCETYCY